MPSSARLAWSDAVMAGRISRGEAWQFCELAHELRLRIDDRLKYLERYRIAPRERSVERSWVAGAATYVATAIVHHARATDDTAQVIHDALAACEGTRAAVDLVEPRLLVSRIMATRGAAFAAARAACRRLSLDTIFASPELAGRKSV
jgi:urease accessory protein UreH